MVAFENHGFFIVLLECGKEFGIIWLEKYWIKSQKLHLKNRIEKSQDEWKAAAKTKFYWLQNTIQIQLNIVEF